MEGVEEGGPVRIRVHLVRFSRACSLSDTDGLVQQRERDGCSVDGVGSRYL